VKGHGVVVGVEVKKSRYDNSYIPPESIIKALVKVGRKNKTDHMRANFTD